MGEAFLFASVANGKGNLESGADIARAVLGPWPLLSLSIAVIFQHNRIDRVFA